MRCARACDCIFSSRAILKVRIKSKEETIRIIILPLPAPIAAFLLLRVYGLENASGGGGARRTPLRRCEKKGGCEIRWGFASYVKSPKARQESCSKSYVKISSHHLHINTGAAFRCVSRKKVHPSVFVYVFAFVFLARAPWRRAAESISIESPTSRTRVYSYSSARTGKFMIAAQHRHHKAGDFLKGNLKPIFIQLLNWSEAG